MKKLLLILLALFILPTFLFPLQSFAATVIAKFNYESPMSLDAAAVESQYWTDGQYGEDGITNSLGYVVPWALPGRCKDDNTCGGTSNTYVPHFNFNYDSDGNNYAEITNEDKVNGTYSLKLVQGVTGRVQHVFFDASTGDPWHTFNRGLIKDWIKFDDLDLPITKWHLIWEMRGGGQLYNNRIMLNYKDGNTIYVKYQYQDATHGIHNYQSVEIDPADYENKWLEVIIAWEFGNPGYFLLKIKPINEPAVEIIRFEGNNSEILTPDPYNIQYPKNYGYNFIQWHDDTTFYANTDIEDLPAWDSGAPAFIISNPYPTGNPTIPCNSNPMPVTRSWNTSNSANCRIAAAPDPGSYAAAPADSVENTDSTSHSDADSFACGTSFTRYVYCLDGFSQEAGPETLTWTIASETSPPDPISGLSFSGIGGAGFNIPF